MSSPVMVSIAASVLAIALPVTAAATVLEVSARASGAADAAALAATDATLGWVTAVPCELAAQVADSAGTSLEQCDIDQASGEARVSVRASTMFGGVHARARAGPPE